MPRLSLRQVRAIAALPVMVLLVMPMILLFTTRSVKIGWSLLTPWALAPTGIGILLAVAGGVLLANTVSLFIRRGRGTLAPWDPTQRLVVQGVFRHVRNPMISGVLGVLLGEAIFFGSWPLALWWGFFLGGNLLYIPLSEEPGLVKRFGVEYEEYRRHVPAWIPRRRPWTPGEE